MTKQTETHIQAENEDGIENEFSVGPGETESNSQGFQMDTGQI